VVPRDRDGLWVVVRCRLRGHYNYFRDYDPTTGPGRELPELLDVRLVAMSPKASALTGFERIDGAAYAQSGMPPVLSGSCPAR
jgi:hypothetical protein